MIPTGKQYDIIYADPPWEYRCKEPADGNPMRTGAHMHYPTMSEDELKLLKVQDLAANDCLLFMWTTGPKLDVAFDVGFGWGFKYATVGFVWDKRRVNAGYYTMSQCEFCLIFKRGRIPKPRGARNVRQFASIDRGSHSVKPAEVRDRIDEMFPHHSKIELFARQRFPGWDAWGNEV